MVRPDKQQNTRNVASKLKPSLLSPFPISKIASFFFFSFFFFLMAEVPLGGELWLPSDILPDEKISSSSSSSSAAVEEEEKFAYMEELAQQLSAYALFEHHQQQTHSPPIPTPSPTPNFLAQPRIRIGSNQPRLGVQFGGNADNGGRRYGTGVLYPPNQGCRLNSGFHSPLITPAATPQVENFTLVRGGRVLQQQQNRIENRFFSGNVRGTGVFLPRVEALPAGGRKHGAGTGTGTGGLKHENNCNMPVKMNSAAGKKKEVVGLKATSTEVVGLPQEWTY